MIAIKSVPPYAQNSVLASHARTLFRAYEEFLRETQSCSGGFNFARYKEEIAALPAPYSDQGGEVLLALDEETDTPAACIAYRTHSKQTCEIKRLFVAEAYRGRGLARQLVTEAITRIAALPFTRIILDTDIVNMPAAHHLYRSFGFREYGAPEGNIVFFELFPKT